MKNCLALMVCMLGLMVIASEARAGEFQVTRKMVQLWSGPEDDMRPEIVGTVTAVSSTSVNLQGGATVPVNNAKVKVGELATFACAEIAQGRNPDMKNCELLRTQPPEKPELDKHGQIKLW